MANAALFYASLRSTVIAAVNSLPLDVRGARAAYGFRKLSTAYSGACCRLINVTGATFDLTFNAAGNLNDSELLSAANGGDLDMTVWFDQSGNANHLFPNGATLRPNVVKAGVINKINGQIAWRSDNTKYLRSSVFLLMPQTYLSAHFVGLAESGATYNSPFAKTTGNNPEPIDFYNDQVFVGGGSDYKNYVLSAGFVPSSGVSLFNSVTNNSNTTVSRNNVNNNSGGGVQVGNGIAVDVANTPLYLGTRNDLVTSFCGYYGEAIFYSDILADAEVTRINSNMMQYFGIT